MDPLSLQKNTGGQSWRQCAASLPTPSALLRQIYLLTVMAVRGRRKTSSEDLLDPLDIQKNEDRYTVANSH